MRVSSVVFVGLLVMITSCGSAPDVPEDTSPVASEPRLAVSEIPTKTEVPENPEPGPPTPTTGPAVANANANAIGFAGHDRFVLYAETDAPSFLVFDREANETFRVLGRPTGTSQMQFDSLQGFMSLAETARRLMLDEDGRGHLLVRSPGGVQLVDLKGRGRMVAAFRGTPVSASIAPDAGMFAVISEDGVHVVRTADSAHAKYAVPKNDGVAISWGERFVWWTLAGKTTRVDRGTFAATTFGPSTGETIGTAISAQGDVIASASKPGTGASEVTIFVSSDLAPATLRFPSPSVDELAIDTAGKTVAWIERHQDPSSNEDVAFMHTVDVASGVHARFRMKGSGCSIAPETLQRVHDGMIVTDASCSIGCPSVRWTSRAVTYDATSGRAVNDVSVAEELSFNEVQGIAMDRALAIAEQLGVDQGAMARIAGKELMLVEKPNALAVVPLEKPVRTRIELEASAGASLAAITFSSDGKILAGIVDGRARAWEAETGKALLR